MNVYGRKFLFRIINNLTTLGVGRLRGHVHCVVRIRYIVHEKAVQDCRPLTLELHCTSESTSRVQTFDPRILLGI